MIGSAYRPSHHGLLCSCGHCYNPRPRHPRRGIPDPHDRAALDRCARCGRLADHDSVRTIFEPHTGEQVIVYCALD